ncbi:uncharacterized protein LOC112662102 isoform X4 [Canis lupus dingo]|uniref:uncharacterized protein LOC112662102 isoform X4 n=1 Tax=Canis lupus dingo TaxID=286419 RepID=UPI000DC7441D|nr:uncharacterized protein LOC112662102 isoform X4 [Canis lupus dingo]
MGPSVPGPRWHAHLRGNEGHVRKRKQRLGQKEEEAQPRAQRVEQRTSRWLPASDHHIRQRRSHPCGQRGEQFQVCWKQEPSCQLYTGTLMPHRQETGHVATSDTPGLPWEGRGVDVEPATGRIHRETRVTQGTSQRTSSLRVKLPGCPPPWGPEGQPPASPTEVPSTAPLARVTPDRLGDLQGRRPHDPCKGSREGGGTRVIAHPDTHRGRR